jgi:hypothetical protein
MRWIAAIVLSLMPGVGALAAEEPAWVIVYAQSGMSARSWFPIAVGEGVAAELKRGHYFVLELAPGNYTLRPAKGIPLALRLRTKEEIYVRLERQFEAGQAPVPALVRVGREQARKEMLFLNYVERKRLHASAALPADPRKEEKLELKVRPKP